MSNEEAGNVLNDLFLSEYSLPLTDEVVDAFLASPAQAPQESGQRVLVLFVHKVLTELYPQPVVRIKERVSFGRWIEAAREKASLTREMVAAALWKEPSFVEAVESESSEPWALKANELADFAGLVRLHFKAVSDLIISSFAVSQGRVGVEMAARKTRGKRTRKQGEAVRRAVDKHLAKRSVRGEISEEVRSCLNVLRRELERRGATEFLD
jgi:hypothetical protein